MKSHKQTTARTPKRRLAHPSVVPVAPAAVSSMHEPEVNAIENEAENEPLEVICGTRNPHMARFFFSQLLSVLPAAADVSESELLEHVWPAIDGIAPQDESRACWRCRWWPCILWRCISCIAPRMRISTG